MKDRLKSIGAALQRMGKSKIIPKPELIVTTCIAMMGVIVNLLLILTVLLTVTDKATAGQIMFLLVPFTVAVICALVGRMESHETLADFFEAVSFVSMLIGLIFFVFLIVQIYSSIIAA